MENYEAVQTSDETIKEKTGRGWKEWVEIIDKAGGADMNHTQIAAYVNEKLGVPGWWSQNVTVGYERIKGRRGVNERLDGYQFSVSKTLETEMNELYDLWFDDEKRKKWLPNEVQMRTSHKNKSVRMLWEDGKTTVEVAFYDKGKGKVNFVIAHSKIENKERSDELKEFWKGKVEELLSALK